VDLVVNGVAREVATEDDTALLYVLRNHLGLKGTRFGCGLGLCGACLVLVDGRAVYSCDTPVWAVRDKEITTVEGLAAHPVPRAMIAGQAAKCGYCMSGVIIAAVELLPGEGNPSLGVGECTLGPTAAAIGNAIRDALGVRVRTLPFTERSIVAAIEEAGS
jgi:nicotinate dehydrogenase subunit A